MKLAIVGSRTFVDYELLKTECTQFLTGYEDVTIIYGVADGADTLGAYFAQENGYKIFPCPVLPEQWVTYGKSAGFKRNRYMAHHCDAAIAFWDGKSSGTRWMIESVQYLDKKVHVVSYDEHSQSPPPSYMRTYIDKDNKLRVARLKQYYTKDYLRNYAGY